MAQFSPGDTVVVLGAGATRGAKWVDSRSACLPPLNGDFFTQLQRIQSAKHQGVVSDVLRDVIGLYGPNFTVTLESYFTQIETLHAMTALVALKNPRYSKERLENMKRRLLLGVSAVLEESSDVVKGTSKARKSPCQFHQRLVEALSPTDTIISFNYDCVIDHALKVHGDGKWSAQYGYGFADPQRVVGYDRWDAASAPTGENLSINLLKLHGSLNFMPFPDDGGEIRLRERPYRQTGAEVYEIIPPEFAKRIDRPEFKVLWRRAERALRLARHLVLIGFSFTPTDLHVDSFFRTAMAGNGKLENVVIVNPNRDDRKRIRSVLATSLARREARVIQFEYFSEFSHQAEALLSRK
jgi:hypothetical protein